MRVTVDWMPAFDAFLSAAGLGRKRRRGEEEEEEERDTCRADSDTCEERNGVSEIERCSEPEE